MTNVIHADRQAQGDGHKHWIPVPTLRRMAFRAIRDRLKKHTDLSRSSTCNPKFSTQRLHLTTKTVRISLPGKTGTYNLVSPITANVLKQKSKAAWITSKPTASPIDHARNPASCSPFINVRPEALSSPLPFPHLVHTRSTFLMHYHVNHSTHPPSHSPTHSQPVFQARHNS